MRREIIRAMAAELLNKLYLMRLREYVYLTVQDILDKATDEEIMFYYGKICKGAVS